MTHPPPPPPPTGGGYPGSPQGGGHSGPPQSGGYFGPPHGTPGSSGNVGQGNLGGPGGPGSPPGGGGSPYGAPQPPEKKSRTGLWIAIACAVVLLLVVILAGGGLGAWLLLREPDDGPSPTATAPQDPTGEPTEDPFDDPTEEPTDEPTDDSGTTSLTIGVNSSEEVSQVETNDGPLDPENGAFFGAEVEITNESSSEEIGLAGENFTFYDDEGNSYHVRYGRFSTSGPQIEPGETATAMIYADVAPGTSVTEVSYTDEVATGGQEVPIPIN